MGLPRLDVVLGLSTSAIRLLIEPAGVALFEIGNDETRVGPLRAEFDAGDYAFDAAPTRRPAVKFLEPTRLPVLRCGLVSRVFVEASSPWICRRGVTVGATPRM